MIDITFRQLEIFIEVAKGQNLRQAGKHLSMSHSAISMAISSLETTLRGPLFDRKNNRLILNERGHYLFQNMSPILMETIDHIDALTIGTISGQLRLGASSTIGNYVLPQLIGQFRQATSDDVDIHLTIGNTASIEKKLHQYDLDMALVEGPISDRRNLETWPWINDELVVISGDPEPPNKHRSLNDLVDRKWVLRETGSGTLSILEHALASKNITLPRTLTMGHTEAVKQAVKANLGISCISKLAIQEELRHGSLHLISIKETLSRTLTLVTPKSRYQTRLMAQFLTFLNSHPNV
jgi:DNA-binding transcriptional LysR family regulator